MSKQQATRCTQKQLAYLSYWRARGYHFNRDEDIPERTCIPPHQMDRPRAIELAVTAGMLIAIFAWEWLK